MPSSAPIGPAMIRLLGATITLPPLQSGLRRNCSASALGCSRLIMRSSTVPQAEITKALLIWANACDDRYPVAQRISAGGKKVRPAHHVDARALGRERKDRQRIGIFAANEPAHRPEFGLESTESVPETAHMHQALADRRHDLLMLADQRAMRTDIDLRVEHGSDG